MSDLSCLLLIHPINNAKCNVAAGVLESSTVKTFIPFLLDSFLQVDFPGALVDLDRSVSLDPTLSVGRYNRATVNYRMGHFDKAMEDFDAACKLEPDNAEYKEGREACKKEMEK